MRVLVTGGAGFVGANVAIELASRHADWQVVALDNLRRRGSELSLGRLRRAGVEFTHGDVREPADLEAVGTIDALVECSAEPSAIAGLDGGLDHLVHTNLVGAYNCLELARRREAFVVFLSSSRVYPAGPLARLELVETETRFELADEQPFPGVSSEGIAEAFPLEGARTPYGATKLAAELLIAEYVESFGLRATVDRFGVIAGPWQMGKVDQGVFAYWLLAHCFGRPLEYIGFGGTGKQVRDVIHILDVVDLLEDQLARPDHWHGMTANVGGGRAHSVSLLELTELCRELTGKQVDIQPAGTDRPGDIPVYLSDCSRLFAHTNWRPQRGPRAILTDTLAWVTGHEQDVRSALGFA
jgi:CDP-paratose 2-epimerase